MRVQYEERNDNRINSRRSFVKEYLIVFTVVLWCCSGSVLIFNAQMKQNANPWFMALIGSSYVLFIGVVAYIAIKMLIRKLLKKYIFIGRAIKMQHFGVRRKI